MKVISVVVLVVALLAVASLLTMTLWNQCLVPAVNGVNEVTWLQMIGLHFLFGVLFSSKNSVQLRKS